MDSDPIPLLRTRIAKELSADFVPDRPVRISRAPGRLDVMGGIADYTGSTVCEMPLDRAVALAMQERSDRELHVFSFNLFDEHVPFAFRIPLAALAATTADALRRDFAEPSRRWAGYLAGCLFILHEKKRIDLTDPKMAGMNLALLSTVPLGAGVSSSAAIEVATMMNLADHFGLRGAASEHSALGTQHSALDPLTLAALCQEVENRIVGAPCGIMDQVTSVAGRAGALLRLVCQPHDLLPPLRLPAGVRVLGINSHVKHSVGGGMYGRTRCAAFMGHLIILNRMRQIGRAAADADPMKGYLANLDPEDYRANFRPLLPASMKGLDFLEQYGPTIDRATTVNPQEEYHIQLATDHHVFEAARVKRFIALLERAAELNGHAARVEKLAASPFRSLLRDAGKLMYESHESYTHNALLGADECDVLVELVKQNESAGLYGAKITGGGSGGTVAILADAGERADEAIGRIMAEYERRTGHKPEAFMGTSAGAWEFGTILT